MLSKLFLLPFLVKLQSFIKVAEICLKDNANYLLQSTTSEILKDRSNFEICCIIHSVSKLYLGIYNFQLKYALLLPRMLFSIPGKTESPKLRLQEPKCNVLILGGRTINSIS